MAELVAQGARLGTVEQPFGRGDDERVADTAAVGVLLVPLQGGVGRHCPTVREVRVRVGPADVGDPFDLVLD